MNFEDRERAFDLELFHKEHNVFVIDVSVKTHHPPRRAVVDDVEFVKLFALNSVRNVLHIHLHIARQRPSVALVVALREPL